MGYKLNFFLSYLICISLGRSLDVSAGLNSYSWTFVPRGPKRDITGQLSRTNRVDAAGLVGGFSLGSFIKNRFCLFIFVVLFGYSADGKNAGIRVS